MTTAMHKRFESEEPKDLGMDSVSQGDGDDARPRKRPRFTQTPPNGVNGTAHGKGKDQKKSPFAPFRPLNWKRADRGRGPPSWLEQCRRELPIFSGKQAILDAFQA